MFEQDGQAIEVDDDGAVVLGDRAAEGLALASTATAIDISDAPDDDESKRHSRVRARTISIKRLSKRELERGRMLYPESEHARPTSRTECMSSENAERPCPYVSCKHHLYLDVNPRTGSIKLNFPNMEVWELPETCALDIADRGGITLEEVGEIMNLTRERIRQLETRGLAKLKAMGEMSSLQDYAE